MLDLGAPASYIVLEEGTAVYAGDEVELGQIAEVRADEGSDIFDGVVVRTRALAGRHFFVAAEDVEEIFERGVVLKLDATAAEALPDAH